MRSSLAAILFVSIPLAACGGKSKPAPQPEPEIKEQPAVVEEDEPPPPEEEEEEEEPYVPPPPAPPDLAGSWTSACTPAPDGKGSAMIDAKIVGDSFEVTGRGFSDAACTKAAWTMNMTGTYAVGEMSTTTADAWAIDFVNATHMLTAANKTSAKSLGKACGIKKMKAGKAYDIHEKGCAAVMVPAAASCPAEHQLVMQDGGRLLFGAGADLCAPERRPTEIVPDFYFRYVWAPTTVPECDQFLAKIDAYVSCQALPRDARNQVFDSIRASFTTDLSQVPADAKAAMGDGCRQGAEGIDQAMAALSCPAQP